MTLGENWSHANNAPTSVHALECWFVNWFVNWVCELG